MPTVLRVGPYRFYFYSSAGTEPAHIHIERDDCVAKFWLDPVRLARSRGFAPAEQRNIEELVHVHRPVLLEAWDEYFGD